MALVSGRVAFFIDGFNLYHAIDAYRQLHKYKWVDLHKLCKVLIPRRGLCT